MAKRTTSGGDDDRIGQSGGGGSSKFGPPLIPQVDLLPDENITGSPEDEYQEREIGDSQYQRDDTDRLTAEREGEERELSDQERLELFRMALFQNQLPALPPLAGYHLCWLTTANPRDSIQGRIRLGYKLVAAEELPGWEHTILSTGPYAGYVGVNEMIAAKLPLRLYELYMTEAHHNQPLAEEGKLRATLDMIKEQAAGQRSAIIPEEGQAQLGANRFLKPRFEGLGG